MTQYNWSDWRPFPDPRAGGYLSAPFGVGVYELRNRATGELVLYGRSENAAFRMSSLLPKPGGAGTRYNKKKPEYVFTNICKIEYRTKACTDVADTIKVERYLRNNNKYIFKT